MKTKDGGKTAVCSITVKKQEVIPPGYSVSAPTNAHWTDDFKVSFTFGKTKDGQPYRTFSYKIYDAATGKAMNNGHGTISNNKDYAELTVGASVFEKMRSGSYYFKVYAEDENRNQISPETKSTTKYYKRPDKRIPTPVNLRWSGTRLLFDFPESYEQYADKAHFQLLYSQTANGTYTKKREGTVNYSTYYKWLERNMDTPGYYKCKIEIDSYDPQVIMSSYYSAESPVYHLTN